MFRRRRRDDPSWEEAQPAAGGDPDVPPESVEPQPEAAKGPWDAGAVPADEVTRLDLGALLVPVSEDMELRVELTADQEPMTATLVEAGGALQLSAFAAPRREGLWAEVRAEIATSVRDAGGTTDEASGPFGPELQARVPGESRGQKLQPARFIGADGPRWFLRGVLTGPAATDPTRAARLEEAFRQVVVVRGGEARAPRDPLPLQLPKDAADQVGTAPELDPLRRGPEITEVR